MRAAVALLVAGFNLLASAGQLALSGLIGLAGLLVKGMAALFDIIGLVSAEFRRQAAMGHAFADRLIEQAARMSVNAQEKIAQTAVRGAKGIKAAWRDVADAGGISARLREEAAARAKLNSELRVLRAVTTNQAEETLKGLKEELKARTDAKELTEEQTAEYDRQAEAAYDVLREETRRARAAETINAQAQGYQQRLAQISQGIAAQVQANREAVRVEEVKKPPLSAV